jgi:hypothetical protein
VTPSALAAIGEATMAPVRGADATTARGIGPMGGHTPPRMAVKPVPRTPVPAPLQVSAIPDDRWAQQVAGNAGNAGAWPSPELPAPPERPSRSALPDRVIAPWWRRAIVPAVAACVSGVLAAVVMHYLELGARTSGPAHGGSDVATPVARPAEGAGKLTEPLDGDPKYFGLTAFLPRATALARKLVPDAELVKLMALRVGADGWIELGELKDRAVVYLFRSRSLGKPTTTNAPGAEGCGVRVRVSTTEGIVAERTIQPCADEIVPAPRCSPADVWQLALARGATGDRIATLAWFHDTSVTPARPRWVFDSRIGDDGIHGIDMFLDDCDAAGVGAGSSDRRP